ncbi:hypothetical protein DYB32_005383 [Aphanomyces invadans]|uniref:Microsomal glutathione S-transferase 1 n=1 Tax=Aphanomyces invadans TaxID=157072 RepID=A0A418AUN1_9STRA|nr:hypothetical protein DYB32_005383 [Aphanomyces invadans]
MDPIVAIIGKYFLGLIVVILIGYAAFQSLKQYQSSSGVSELTDRSTYISSNYLEQPKTSSSNRSVSILHARVSMGALAGDVRVAALCTLVLYIKFYAALFVQGTVKYKSGSRPPEDMTFAATTAPNKELFIPETSEDKLEAAKAREHRWNRIVGNDLENLPLGIMMAWVAIVAGGNGTVTSIAIILFTVSRIAHSIAFANAMFLPRTISFQVGALCTVALAINAVAGSFS